MADAAVDPQATMATLHRALQRLTKKIGEQPVTWNALEDAVRSDPRLGDADATVDGTEWLARLRESAFDQADVAEALRPSWSRLIVEDDFEGTWPFTVPGGVLVGHASRAMMFGSLDGPMYGLNAHALQRGCPPVDPIWKPRCDGLRVTLADMASACQELVDLAVAEERRQQAEQRRRREQGRRRRRRR